MPVATGGDSEFTKQFFVRLMVLALLVSASESAAQQTLDTNILQTPQVLKFAPPAVIVKATTTAT